MNKDLCFGFYSVVKNEDADPFVGDNVIAVADGVGGRGGMVHPIDREKHENVQDDLIGSAFGDFDPEKASKIEDYIEKLIQPILDETPKTSALWGSRVVISRCVYALTCEEKFANGDLSNDELRAELADFIEKTLKDVKEEFDLRKGSIEDQQIMPTTLSAIRFHEDDDKVTAESIWAGDSRCYALTKDGLIPLSVDEEDSTGVMTNKFYYDYEASLRYSKAVFDKPCVLMTVSDGIFDPFGFLDVDHFGVENIFMDKMLHSGSIEELRDNLYNEYFVNIRGDDATVAFVPFGFESYDDMKSFFRERGEFVNKTYLQQRENARALQLMNATSDTFTPYVRTRTSDKYPFIVGKLMEILSSNTDDIVATGVIKSTYDEIVDKHRIEMKNALTNGRVCALKSLLSTFKNDSTDISTFISDDKLSALLLSASGADKTTLADLLKSLKSYLADARGFDSKKTAVLNKKIEYNEYLQLLYDEINSVRAEIDASRDKLDEVHESEREASTSTNKKLRSKIGSYIREYCEDISKLRKRESDLYDIELMIAVKEQSDFTKEEISKYKSTFKKMDSLVKRLRDYKELRSNLIQAETGIKRSADKLKKSVEGFISYCLKAGKILDVFDDKYSSELSLASLAENKEFMVTDSILSEIKDTLLAKKDDVIECIVSALKERCSEASSLDFVYDKKRLANFKEYHKSKAPSPELIALKSTIESIFAKYEEYLSKI